VASVALLQLGHIEVTDASDISVLLSRYNLLQMMHRNQQQLSKFVLNSRASVVKMV